MNALYKGKEIYSFKLSHHEFELLDKTQLTCVHCGSKMTTAHSPRPRRTPFFRHVSKRECKISNKISLAHQSVQAWVKWSIEQVYGWQGIEEFAGNGFRADVMAVSMSTIECTSFEVQFSGMKQEDMKARTERHLADGVKQVFWLCAKPFDWEDEVPSVRLLIENWDLQTMPYVECKVPPQPSQTDGEAYGVVEVPLNVFVRKMLLKERIPKLEKLIVTRYENEYTICYCNAYLYELPDQAYADFYAQQVKKLEEQQEREWRREQARMNEFRRVAKRRKYIEDRRQLVDEFKMVIPNIIFEKGVVVTAYGDFCSLGGKLLVVNPVVSHIDRQKTPILFEATTVLVFRQYQNYAGAVKRLETSANAHLLTSILMNQELIKALGLQKFVNQGVGFRTWIQRQEELRART